jgi:hypothetical protein
VTTSARVERERVGRCIARARERGGSRAEGGVREVETRGRGDRARRRLRESRAFESVVTRGRRREARWRREDAREGRFERVSRAVTGERSSRGVDDDDDGRGERVWGFRARRRGGRGKTVDDGGASVERREGGSGVE